MSRIEAQNARETKLFDAIVSISLTLGAIITMALF